MRNFCFTTLALAAALSAVGPVLSQKTIFVAPGGTGDGSSWAAARSDLQAALKQAVAGTQIWVAEGIYTPTDGKKRAAAFELPDGVRLMGGFAGTEKKPSERKTALHPTILSGNIGSQDPGDNSFNVVRMAGASSATVLDGFIVSGGYADGNAQEGEHTRSGGAIFNDGSKKPSNPQIVGCTFIDNFAKDGGAVYNYGRGGEASPTFSDCAFLSNSADLDGGAVNCDGRTGGESSPVFKRCHFESNRGNYGGAAFFHALNGQSEPVLEKCTFSENVAWVRGGGIFRITAEAEAGGNDDLPAATGSVFKQNRACYPDSADFETFSLR